MPEITHRKKRLSSFKLIVLGFAGVILLGALIIDAAVFIDCRSCYAVSRGAVHIDLGRLRYGGWLCRIRAVIGPLSGRR